jgi:RNA polymerase sigma-70 factor (ECF subfamily)
MRSALLAERSRNVSSAVPITSISRWNPPAAKNPRIPAAKATPAAADFESLVDDAILIDRIAAGDQDAARALVERLRPTILKCIRRRLPRWAEEDDLMQTVFAKVFSKLNQFSGSVPLEHWVARIAVNTSLHQIDYESVRPEFRMSDLTEEQEALLHNQPVFYYEAQEKEHAREALELLLAPLRPDERLIVTLLHIEQRSTREISRMTGLSISLIKVKAFRTRHKMRRLATKLVREEVASSVGWQIA